MCAAPMPEIRVGYIPGRMKAILEFGIELARPTHRNVIVGNREIVFDIYWPETRL